MGTTSTTAATKSFVSEPESESEPKPTIEPEVEFGSKVEPEMEIAPEHVPEDKSDSIMEPHSIMPRFQAENFFHYYNNGLQQEVKSSAKSPSMNLSFDKSLLHPRGHECKGAHEILRANNAGHITARQPLLVILRPGKLRTDPTDMLWMQTQKIERNNFGKWLPS